MQNLHAFGVDQQPLRIRFSGVSFRGSRQCGDDPGEAHPRSGARRAVVVQGARIERGRRGLIIGWSPLSALSGRPGVRSWASFTVSGPLHDRLWASALEVVAFGFRTLMAPVLGQWHQISRPFHRWGQP